MIDGYEKSSTSTIKSKSDRVMIALHGSLPSFIILENNENCEQLIGSAKVNNFNILISRVYIPTASTINYDVSHINQW